MPAWFTLAGTPVCSTRRLPRFNARRRLDPAIRTSVAHSFYMLGEFERAIELDRDDPPYLSVMALVQLGRTSDAAALCAKTTGRSTASDHMLLILDAMSGMVERDPKRVRATIERLLSFPAFTDPEGLYYWAHGVAGVGELDWALELLGRAVDSGLHCPRALESSPGLHFVRSEPGFAAVLDRARAGHTAAVEAFTREDGYQLLGLARPSTTRH